VLRSPTQLRCTQVKIDDKELFMFRSAPPPAATSAATAAAAACYFAALHLLPLLSLSSTCSMRSSSKDGACGRVCIRQQRVKCMQVLWS
jgi:hypothetical protein